MDLEGKPKEGEWLPGGIAEGVGVGRTEDGVKVTCEDTTDAIGIDGVARNTIKQENEASGGVSIKAHTKS